MRRCVQSYPDEYCASIKAATRLGYFLADKYRALSEATGKVATSWSRLEELLICEVKGTRDA